MDLALPSGGKGRQSASTTTFWPASPACSLLPAASRCSRWWHGPRGNARGRTSSRRHGDALQLAALPVWALLDSAPLDGCDDVSDHEVFGVLERLCQQGRAVRWHTLLATLEAECCQRRAVNSRIGSMHEGPARAPLGEPLHRAHGVHDAYCRCSLIGTLTARAPRRLEARNTVSWMLDRWRFVPRSPKGIRCRVLSAKSSSLAPRLW